MKWSSIYIFKQNTNTNKCVLVIQIIKPNVSYIHTVLFSHANFTNILWSWVWSSLTYKCKSSIICYDIHKFRCFEATTKYKRNDILFTELNLQPLVYIYRLTHRYSKVSLSNVDPLKCLHLCLWLTTIIIFKRSKYDIIYLKQQESYCQYCTFILSLNIGRTLICDNIMFYKLPLSY